MAFHAPSKWKEDHIRDAVVGTLVCTGNLPNDYRGNLNNEVLDVDSLGVYNVALELSDRLGIEISDDDIKKMFGSFEMDMSDFISTPRNNVRVSDIMDYLSEKLWSN